MLDQQHFKYEGNIVINNPKEIEVKSIESLTPIYIKYIADGKELVDLCYINYITNEVFTTKEYLKKYIIEFIKNNKKDYNLNYNVPDEAYEQIKRSYERINGRKA